MVAELACDLAADLRSDVRVAITVGADPAARMEERGAHRWDETRLVAEDPIVETTVDERNRVEQRVVEDIEDGVGLFDRRRLLQCNRRSAEQCVDLVVEATVAFLLIGAAEHLAAFQQLGDTADLAFDSLTAGFGRMRGEHGVELKLVEQLLRLRRAHFNNELVIGVGHLIDRVDHLVIADCRFALMQHGYAVVLFAQVRQMEVGGERAREQLRIMQIHRIDGFNCLVQLALPLTRAGVNTGEMLGAGVGHILADGIECFEQFGIEFAKHFAHDLQTQIHVVLQRIGESTLFRAFGARAGRHDTGVGWRDLLIFCCH